MIQRFVRAFVVVLVPKPIEADLLRLKMGARWACGLSLQRPMHPLVAPVLLGQRGGDQFGRMPSRIHHTESGERRPARVFRSVDLPEPFGPMIA